MSSYDTKMERFHRHGNKPLNGPERILIIFFFAMIVINFLQVTAKAVMFILNISES